MQPTRPAFFHQERPYLVAHRGGGGRWPENTLLAFRGAQQLGIRQIETDLHLTRDGQLVCFHDASLERTTDGRGDLAERSLAELKQLDAAHHFSQDGGFPYRGQGVTIPTFEEALAVHPDLHFTLEIKPRGPSLPHVLHQEILRLGAEERVLVASAHEPTVAAFRRLAGPAICTSAGQSAIFRFWFASRLGLAHHLRPDFQALQVPPASHGLTVVDRRFVEAAHAARIEVQVWTIDDRAEMERLYGLGVDAILTDLP